MDLAYWGATDFLSILFAPRIGQPIDLGIGFRLIHYMIIGLTFLGIGFPIMMIKRHELHVALAVKKPETKGGTYGHRTFVLVTILIKTAVNVVLSTWGKFKSFIKGLYRPYRRIVTTLIISGITAFFISMMINSAILAFIGLGLILWGILFLFAKPYTVASVELTNSAMVPPLMIIDRTISNLDYQKGVYIPPEYIKGFRGGVMLLPKNKHSRHIKQIVKERAFPNLLETYIVPPPGIGIINLIEKQLNVDFSEKDFDFLRNNLTRLLVDLEMVENLDIEVKGKMVYARMVGSTYSNFCIELRKHQTRICTYVGCPLCSSLAYALTKVIKKPIVIERNEISSDGKTIEAWYKIVEDLD